MTALEPQSIDEVVDLIRSPSDDEQWLPVGGCTKPRLSSATPARRVSLRKLSGVTRYEPSEFTFTARAGTPIKEIDDLLCEHHQYLPFGSMYAGAGATLGGTVAAGLSGAGRFRFGGVRDFLLGVRLITGDGQLITAGGRVVKNAAGFDIPRMVVGSCGRFGILAELTFKVFPLAESSETIKVACASHAEAMDRMNDAACQPWELDAIDYDPKPRSLFLRLSAVRQVVELIAPKIVNNYGDDAHRMTPHDATEFWHTTSEQSWAPADSAMVKVPTTASSFLQLQIAIESSDGVQVRLSGGGATCWLAGNSAQDVEHIDEVLHRLDLSGLAIRGDCPKMWLGKPPESAMIASIQGIMDPQGRFPSFR